MASAQQNGRSAATTGTPRSGSFGAGGILALIRDGNARTRAELAEATGLARSTIAQRLDALFMMGMVVDVGGGVSTGGRPSSVLAFNADAGIVLAADLGATHSRLAVTNLSGKVITETAQDIAIAAGPEAVIDWLERSFDDLLLRVGRRVEEVRAIGVGVPGPVDFASGKPVNPPIMPGWHGYPVTSRLRERYGAPTLLDNDVNIMALGEHAARWPDVAHLVFVKVGTGIGMGIIANGALHRGARGSAGDIGHVRVKSRDDVVCACGNHGCLEAIAGGGALAAELAALGFPTENARTVVDQVRAGNADAVRLVRQAGRELGDALAAVVNVLNPGVLVIGGDLAGAGELLLAGLREVIYQRSTALATHSLEIVLSTTGDYAGVLGASAMASEHILAPAAIDEALLVGSA